jgi:RND family efflux transporter MFP subunit
LSMKQLLIELPLALFFSWGLLGCGEKIEPGTTPPGGGPTVKAVVGVAQITVQPRTYEAVGTVQPRTAGTLSSKVMGNVLEVRVNEGDRVQKGEVLAVLDSLQIAARLREAEAGLAEARRAETAAGAAREAALANAVQAESAYDRARNLLAGEAMTEEGFEAAEAKHKEAQAALSQAEAMLGASQYRVKQAQAAVEAVMVNQKDTLILAPYDGKVTRKMAEVGDLASPGTPILSLEATDGYQVELILPETYIQQVRLGQRVKLKVPSISDQAYEGVIETIVPQADTQSLTFYLKVGLSGNGSLKPGLFARVVVPIGEERILLVPDSATVHKGQLTGLFTVTPEGVARFRLIRTGRVFGDQIEVVTGLEPGYRFVVSPPPALVDGAQVETTS